MGRQRLQRGRAVQQAAVERHVLQGAGLAKPKNNLNLVKTLTFMGRGKLTHARLMSRRCT